MRTPLVWLQTVLMVLGPGSLMASPLQASRGIADGMDGEYNALLDPWGAPTGDTIGLVSITLNRTGTFSGKLRLARGRIAFRGILRDDGVAQFQPHLGTSLDAGTAGSLSFGITEAGGLVGGLGSAASGSSQANSVNPDASGPTFVGHISPYSRTNRVPGTLLNVPFGAVVPTKGLYNARMYQSGGIGIVTGFGFASVSIENTGRVRMRGMLPDGSKVSAGSRLRSDGTAPVFASLYWNKGGFGTNLGFQTVTEVGLIGEQTVWVRPANTNARYFPDGWPRGLALSFSGDQWNGSASIDFGSAAPGAGGNTTLGVERGASETITTSLPIFARDNSPIRIVRRWGRFDLNPATGLFSGRLKFYGFTAHFRGMLHHASYFRGGLGLYRDASAGEISAVSLVPLITPPE